MTESFMVKYQVISEHARPGVKSTNWCLEDQEKFQVCLSEN